MALRKLEVYLHGKKSGVLTDNDGALNYKYVNNADRPLSVRLPVREQEYGDRECRPFFENLLPEGGIRSMIAARERVSEGNVFSLLDKIGGDCAGAVSLYEEGKKPHPDGSHGPKEMSEDELYGIIDAQKESPLLTGKNIRLSLAGAQAKFAVYMKDGRFYYPDDDYFSSHLIKPESAGFEELVINEYFCMKLAGRLGVLVPDVRLKRLKDHDCLIIDRFDRTIEGDNRERIHQEDLCQVLGCVPDRKYQKEGGPGLKDCYRFLSGESGIRSSERFVSAIVYNYIIGNCDAHAKNFSILHDVAGINAENGVLRAAKKMGAVTLSPFYDLVSTDAYDGLSKEMAMKLGRAWDIREVQRSDFYRVAEELGIKRKELDGILAEFQPVQEYALEVMRGIKGMGFDPGVCNKIVKGIKNRMEKVSAAK
ncbi:MAG: type II toxin-antitoxin system HipA family toxin [Spirochaetia bacterium]|nr:type II toxin-antitoxin system HipA family toxin [Spirochaetia bacterium]